jgi:predicted transcriptional regulator
METKNNEIVGLAADIVAAYVGNNPVPVTNLPNLINEVYRALSGAVDSGGEKSFDDGDLRPAVPVKRSIRPDYLICLEDGKKFKSLKRHLRTHYDLTPEQYREKWNLPSDYPMVAPNYAEARSNLAKQMGLGRSRREVA